jgi:hypothetical protein
MSPGPIRDCAVGTDDTDAETAPVGQMRYPVIRGYMCMLRVNAPWRTV